MMTFLDKRAERLKEVTGVLNNTLELKINLNAKETGIGKILLDYDESLKVAGKQGLAENPYRAYTFADARPGNLWAKEGKSTLRVFRVSSDENMSRSLMQEGIDETRFGWEPVGRGGKRLYYAQDLETGKAERVYHGKDSIYVESYDVDLYHGRVADFRDPVFAKAVNYNPSAPYEETTEAFQRANLLGYDIVIYPSERNVGHLNVTLLRDADDLISPLKLVDLRTGETLVNLTSTTFTEKVDSTVDFAKEFTVEFPSESYYLYRRGVERFSELAGDGESSRSFDKK